LQPYVCPSDPITSACASAGRVVTPTQNTTANDFSQGTVWSFKSFALGCTEIFSCEVQSLKIFKVIFSSELYGNWGVSYFLLWVFFSLQEVKV
jgi:hypothetical protein